MPAQDKPPGVYIEEIPSGPITIAGVATSITAFVGRTPMARASRCLARASIVGTERQKVSLCAGFRTPALPVQPRAEAYDFGEIGNTRLRARGSPEPLITDRLKLTRLAPLAQK